MVDTQEVMESYGLYNIGKVKKSIGNDLGSLKGSRVVGGDALKGVVGLASILQPVEN